MVDDFNVVYAEFSPAITRLPWANLYFFKKSLLFSVIIDASVAY